MANVNDAYEWVCSNESWLRAQRLSTERIETEYRRDVRLNIPQMGGMNPGPSYPLFQILINQPAPPPFFTRVFKSSTG